MIEAIVSLVISSALVALIGTVFVVQTEFYGSQLQRTAAQDNARSVTELISMELRTTMADGILVANDTQLVVRSPIRIAVTCDISVTFTHVFYDGGEAELDKDEMRGIAVYDFDTEVWAYGAASYVDINAVGESAQQQCEATGADTTGAWNHFNTLKKVKQATGYTPVMGSLIMFYRETEFVLTESTLDPGTISLYRGSYGETLVEFASGMDSTAQFSYRTGGSTYASEVTGGGLGDIDAVRLAAVARIRAQRGGKPDRTAGWSVNVPLRNVH